MTTTIFLIFSSLTNLFLNKLYIKTSEKTLPPSSDKVQNKPYNSKNFSFLTVGFSVIKYLCDLTKRVDTTAFACSRVLCFLDLSGANKYICNSLLHNCVYI